MKPYYEHAGITIYHGDCREIIDSLEYDLVITDPPYGMDLKIHRNRGALRYQPLIKHDDCMGIGVGILEQVKTRPTICFAHPLRPWPGKWRQALVWDKGPAVGGGGDPARMWKATWELILYRNTGLLHGGRDSAVLRYWVTPQLSREHPAAKPVELLTYLIRKTSDSGTILDPFMGSGTTLRAAKDLGRKAIGVEIEERYCEIAAKRLSQEVLAF